MAKKFQLLRDKLFKSNGKLPDEVLIPIKEITLNDLPQGTKVTIETVPKAKRKYTRRKPNVTH